MSKFLFALLGGILIYNLIMIIFAKKRKRLSNLSNRLKKVSKLESAEKSLNESSSKSFSKRIIAPIINKITGFIGNLLPNTKDKKSKLALDLKTAGIWISPKEYTSRSIMIFMFFALIGGFLALIFNLDIVYIGLSALFFFLVGYVFRRFTLQRMTKVCSLG